MISKLAKIWAKIKGNQRYAWVFLVLLAVFFINSGFPAEIITSENCSEGKCQTSIENPSLKKDTDRFYSNDLFSSNSEEYYRLIFQVRSNQNTSLEIFATNSMDEDREIGKLTLTQPNAKKIREIIFSTDKRYTDILFQKPKGDSSEVFIDQISISKLNIQKEEDLRNLKPAIVGGADFEVEDQKQLNNTYRFDQLKEKGVVFGQVFRPSFNYITGVELDLDVVRQSNNGGKKYALELREVEYESIQVPEIKSHPLSVVKFSVDDLDYYRQENGKYRFPILAKVEPGKDYFLGINNDRIEPDAFNYLMPKGTRENSAYSEGSVAVKYSKNSFLADGDLYFKTFGFELRKYEDVPVIPGSLIEDRGKGTMFFSYKSLGNQMEMINLSSKSEDIRFDKEKKSLVGEIGEEAPSFLVYHFETILPFKTFSIKANQGDPTWNKLKLSYSFNQKDWIGIEAIHSQDSKEATLQQFDFRQEKINRPEKELYLRIEPDKDKYPEQKIFGLKDLIFEASLTEK